MLTVIVPVFNALAALERCLRSLEAHAADASLLLIDDASSDARVSALLCDFVARDPARRRLIVNPKNRGFVHSVNRGLAESEGDVVLLNSDTVVTAGWLESLRRCLDSDLRIATATPWSNNATICSLPRFLEANPEPADPERWAQAARAKGPPSYPDIPTAVGFCMAIRRQALRELGDFDEATFGRGYGEENDFCMRASAFGWRHVLCDDAYVVHQGGASFAATGEQPGGEALARLSARYPHYQRRIAEFIAADPLELLREAVIAAYAGIQDGRLRPE
jgi:GT2 family glycosyltransferase